MPASPRTFPPGFLFGAATAALQIEGAAHEDGRQDSIWDAFCRVQGAVLDGDTVEVACDHYHRMPEDVALMKELGLQTYRFSASWARVRPDGSTRNQAGIDFYSRLVDELLAADILPWLTLYHWDLPQAIQDSGGWAERKSADLFTEYALDLYEALGDRVTVWTTLNEPWCSSFLSYTAGVHAPGHTSVREGLLAAHHLLLGHGQVTQELRARDPKLTLGITLNLTVADPADPADAADADAARRIDGQFNRWFLDPVFRGSYPQDTLADIRAVDPEAVAALELAIAPGDLTTIAAPIDVLGVNYYHGELLSGHPQPAAPGAAEQPDETPAGEARAGEAPTTRAVSSPFPAAQTVHWRERSLPRTAMDWEVQPEGLTRLLRRVSDEYTAPAGTALYITENGAAYRDAVTPDGARLADPERTAFLRDHLAAVLDAIDAGVDVRGYFYWSLMDNFEWGWGYSQRFGIVHVDFDSQRRLVKDSGRAYAEIIRARRLDGA